MARRMNHAYPRAIDVVKRSVVHLDELVSQHFLLAEAATAFEVASRREALKTVVAPTNRP